MDQDSNPQDSADLQSLMQAEQAKYSQVRERKPLYGFGKRQVQWLSARDNNFTRSFFDALRSADIMTALDVGCGGGTVMDLVKDHVQVQGVDIYPDAPNQRPDLRIHHMNAASLEFDDDSFDIVYHLDGMEHIPAELERCVLREEFRVARRLVFHEIALVLAAGDRALLAEGKPPLHTNLKPPDEWRRVIDPIAEKAGFSLKLTYLEAMPVLGEGLRSTLGNIVRRLRGGRIGRLCLVYERAPTRQP